LAVKKIGEKYRCNVCGNEVLVTKVGGGTLVCCGEEMELLGAELKEEHEEEELEEEEDEWEKHEEEEDLQ
jgi:desulfoferrodoxin-like iron-binding protein